MFDLEHTVVLVAERMGGELLPPHALRGLLQTARRCPAAARSLYVETRLGSQRGPIDLLVAYSKYRRRRAAASAAAAATRCAPELRRALERWCQPGRPAAEPVPLIWAEYDGVQAEHEPGVPSLSACVQPDYLTANDSLQPRLGCAERRAIAQAVSDLSGQPPSASQRSAVAQVVRALEPSGGVVHASVMLGRRPQALKLYVRTGEADLRHCLHALELSLAPADEALFLRLSRGLLAGNVYLDLTANAAGRIDDALLGLAFSQQHVSASAGDGPARRELLERCRAEGLCTSGEARALSRWANRERVRFPGQEWPAMLHAFLDLKLVLGRGRPPCIKAYLGASPRFSVLEAS